MEKLTKGYFNWFTEKESLKIAELKAKYRTEIAIKVLLEVIVKSEAQKGEDSTIDMVAKSYAIADELIKQQYAND